ncbi:MAG: hypothetical protein M3506_00445 [Chloroflexota bacterium]|nr:hypothetical protein [Chloroflexota bacterium]
MNLYLITAIDPNQRDDPTQEHSYFRLTLAEANLVRARLQSPTYGYEVVVIELVLKGNTTTAKLV